MQGKAAYIRTKMVGPFPGPYARKSYVNRAALFIDALLSRRKVITKNVKKHPLIPQTKLRGIPNHNKVEEKLKQ
jgi:hypothetical protein